MPIKNMTIGNTPQEEVIVKKRIFIFIYLFISMFCLSLTSVEAAERRSFYSGARCQAMGGACIAVTNDETALIVNPAALGKVRDSYGTFFDPELEFGYEFQGLYQDKNFSNPYSLEDIIGSLNKKRGSYYHTKIQFFPSFVTKNFGVGFYGNHLLDAEMSADGSTINTYFRNDYAFILGFNFRFFDGRMKLGFNTKLISRIEVDKSNLSSAGPFDSGSIGSEGVGLSTDVGLILAAPWTYLPTLSAVVRDVGNTSFDQASGVRLTTSTRPNLVKQDIDVGAALFPIHNNYLRSSISLEYRGLLTSQDEPDKAKLIHAGLELNMRDVLFLRAGYNQRYWTAGMEWASERFQFQFATFGEEIGTVDTPREDRRYTFKFAYRY